MQNEETIFSENVKKNILQRAQKILELEKDPRFDFEAGIWKCTAWECPEKL